MEQKSVHRFIYKIESKELKKANWNLTLPLKTAMRNRPEVIVSLNDSQCLRFIDEINQATDINDKVRAIQKKIRDIKKRPKSRENRKIINGYYDTLYELQFQKDYLCVIMSKESDYDLCNNGFAINYGDCSVRYRRLLGTNGGIKNSTIVYVNENIYPELKRRLDNGRNMDVPLVPAKLEAYQALICSGSIPLPKPHGIIVVPDCITRFKEDIILIDDSVSGEPKLTREHDYEIEHNDSDGYGLMLPSYSRRVNDFLSGDGEHTIAGMNTRYAFTKGMLYTFDFIEFAEKVAGTYEVTDVWGTKRDIRQAEVILTESMLKLWSSYQSWEDYYENCEKNGYRFSVTKTTLEKLESVRDTNYQFLQSYQFTDDELSELCKQTIDEVQDIAGLDYRKSIVFLCGYGLNDNNVFADNIEDVAKALMIDRRLINDPFVRNRIFNRVKNRILMGERGAIRVDANYAMISGDPYALSQSMFGLEVTGLLGAGEVYHKYWLDKGADEISCFRAPMTCHNNIRRMKLSHSEQAAYWYRYIDTVLIYNAWDSATEAENGADKDGDTNMCTDNPIIVRNTRSEPTIVCLQKKAAKIVPTEEDIIIANKLAFNDDIGTVTNHVTSMIEVQAGFEPGTKEYEELSYRIMCGQLYQQNTIDRAKGIIANPMPSYWYSMRDNKVDEDDTEELKQKKEFNSRIAASKKPYFMTYVYPRLKSENDTYLRNNNRDAVRRFWKYNINSIEDLFAYEDKTDEMISFCDYYKRLLPVGYNTCVINRISWLFEKAFHGFVSRFSRMVGESGKFDYSILKSGVEYSKSDYDEISKIYCEYLRRVDAYQERKRTEKIDKFDNYVEQQTLIDYFKSECYKVCPNAEELCDIVLDICYRRESTKIFAWNMCGDTIINNLLKKNGYLISYPQEVDGGGDFTYGGRSFAMTEKRMEVDAQ